MWRQLEGAISPARGPQQPVIDFLRSASHGGMPVKQIDTHAAMVFLAGERAFKIKRAVRFPFLDYSLLKSARKPVNPKSRSIDFAPAIYRGTSRSHARKRHARDRWQREPVEWSVVMAVSTKARRSITWLTLGRIDDALADALGRAIAACALGRRRTVADGKFFRHACQNYRAERDGACGLRRYLFDSRICGRFAAGNAGCIRARETVAGRARARRTRSLAAMVTCISAILC